MSREIISQSRHVESEKPRNVGPREWNQLFFLAQRRNSRRQMAVQKKRMKRGTIAVAVQARSRNRETLPYERLPCILTRLTLAYTVVNPPER